MCFLSDPSPPKTLDDRSEFGNKNFGEENVGHVVHQDRRKDRFYKLKPRSVESLSAL